MKLKIKRVIQQNNSKAYSILTYLISIFTLFNSYFGKLSKSWNLCKLIIPNVYIKIATIA